VTDTKFKDSSFDLYNEGGDDEEGAPPPPLKTDEQKILQMKILQKAHLDKHSLMNVNSQQLEAI